MFSASGINLTTLIKRLEAATSRLEDLAVANTENFKEAHAAHRSSTTPSLSKETSPAFNTGVFTPEQARTSMIEETSAAPEEKSPVIQDYEKLISDLVDPWVAKSEKIEQVVGEQAQAVQHLFQVQLVFLNIVLKAQQPASPQVFLELLGPTQGALDSVTSIKEKNRASKFFNHLSTVGEGISALGWVTMEGAEAPKYVGEMRDASQFYGNRVVREYKDSGDETHKEWQTTFTEILNELQKYVRKHFPQGIKWNPAGSPADSFIGAALEVAPSAPTGAPTASVPPTTEGAPPPPPPPPPPPAPESLMPKSTSSAPPSDAGSTMGAVFSQLNQGEGITKSLKHVDKSQMTHKNPTLREKKTSPTPAAKPASLRRNASGASTTSTTTSSAATSKTGKKQLEGVKWENFEGEQQPIVVPESETDISHSFLIFGVKNSTIQIGGKINQVSMNNCEGTGLVLDALVGGLEISKSRKVQIQITDKSPMINLDHVDQATIYLSKTGLDVEIITSCTTGVNIQIPNEKEEGDYLERAVPESMRHMVSEGRLVSGVLEHAG